MTYGRFKWFLDNKIQNYNFPRDYEQNVITKKAYRRDTWRCMHLRVIKAQHLKMINPIDFLQENGDFIFCSTDMVESFASLELCKGRHKQCSETLMIYNRDNSVIYSLLASLKTLNSESMFADMSNNVPTEYKRMYSTDYLKNIDAETLPICIEAKVYPTDKEEEVITGWVREGDYENIDPVALKEGYINAGATLDADNATGAPLEDGWASAKNTETAMNAQSDAVSN